MTSRRPPGSARKTTPNAYNLAAGRDVYEAIPKAVWAAIAISALTSGGDQIEYARERVLWEWQCLHDNAIVPQQPPLRYRPIKRPQPKGMGDY